MCGGLRSDGLVLDDVERPQLAGRADGALAGVLLVAVLEGGAVDPVVERLFRAPPGVDEADAAPDVITELHSTNKLLAAIAGELVAQRSLMAAMLEITASKALQEQPVLFTSSAATNFALPGAAAPLGN